MRRFLQRPLDAFGDLLQRVVDRRARPSRLDNHCLDDEDRVLVPAETKVRKDTGHDGNDHEVDDQRAMLKRPF